MTYQLPTFKGWTVNARLREFRKLSRYSLRTLAFDTDEGEALLSKYIKTLDANSEEFKRVANAV